MRNQSGFTFIEVIVAMLIGGVVIASIFQLLQANSRFIELQSAREEVQQNARAALELIAAEVRATAPDGIVEMTPQSVRLLQPRAWGLLCEPATPVVSVVHGVFAAGVLPDEELYGRQHWGVALSQRSDPLHGPGAFRYLRAPAEPASEPSCTGLTTLSGPDRVFRGFQGGAGAFVAGDPVPAGAPLMIFEEVAYDVAASTSGGVPGLWIRRMTGYAGSQPNMQPMAGPVEAEDGLHFTYLRADGVTPATMPDQVRLIEIRVITRSGRPIAGGAPPMHLVDTVAAVVSLRNSPTGGP